MEQRRETKEKPLLPGKHSIASLHSSPFSGDLVLVLVDVEAEQNVPCHLSLLCPNSSTLASQGLVNKQLLCILYSICGV